MKTSLGCTALRYEIDDIRLFFDNNLRFLQQFSGLPGR